MGREPAPGRSSSRPPRRRRALKYPWPTRGVRVGVVRYPGGNVGSLMQALRRAGAEPAMWDGEGDVDALVLPGVGFFATAAPAASAVLPYVGSVPLLGICLGMQLMFRESEEGGAPGLGLFPAGVVRLRSPLVPHTGWEFTRSAGCPLVEDGYYYYMHSYGVEASGAPYEGAHVELERRYVAAVCDESRAVYGVQFHPERSGRQGLGVLRAFLRLARR